MKKDSNKLEDKDDPKTKLKTVLGSKIEAPIWTELSDDLVSEIMSRLCLLSDQVRFCAVCKKWMQAVDQYDKSFVSLPWVVDVKTSHGNIECHLYEPLSSNITKPTLVYRKYLPNFDIDFPYYYKLRPDTSTHKYGWIFSSIRIVGSYFTNFFLFSPLTKNEIVLPRLEHLHFSNQLLTKTFSTRPDSQDCVFLVLCGNISKNTITINIFRHGYKEWKTQEFDAQRLCISRFHNIPVNIDGTFYFVFPIAQLASYNIARGEWKVESVLLDDPKDNRINEALFEVSGELMLLGICADCSYIKKFDMSRKAWVPLESLGELESLGDNSIFINNNSIFLLKIKKEGKSSSAVSRNKMYCGRYVNHNVYSLESGTLATFSDESEITKWAKANNLCGYWFEPPDDLVKRKEPRNSPRKLMQEQTKPGKVEQSGS